MEIDEVIRRTDKIIAEKNREIEELQYLLNNQSDSLGSLALGAAALEQVLDQDAIVILATHDLDLADGLVTRVALIRDGRLVSDESSSTGLRARYRTLVSGTASRPSSAGEAH